MSHAAAKVRLAKLPPTSPAAHQHALRTYYQVQDWLGDKLNPSECGWQKTETMYLPIMTTDPLAPSRVLKMLFCSCKKNCQSNCGCRKAGVKCTIACKGYKGASCDNCKKIASQIEEEINEEGETIVEEENETGDQALDALLDSETLGPLIQRLRTISNTSNSSGTSDIDRDYEIAGSDKTYYADVYRYDEDDDDDYNGDTGDDEIDEISKLGSTEGDINFAF